MMRKRSYVFCTTNVEILGAPRRISTWVAAYRQRWVMLILGVGLTLIALPGCKQGEGEPCQVHSDCQDDLFCCFDEGQFEDRITGRGTCQIEEQCEFVERDGGAPDAAPSDGSSAQDAAADGTSADASAPADASAADMLPDTVEADASPSDGAANDT